VFHLLRYRIAHQGSQEWVGSIIVALSANLLPTVHHYHMLSFAASWKLLSKSLGSKSSSSLSAKSRVLGSFSEIGVPASWGLLRGSKIGLTRKLLLKLVVGELSCSGLESMIDDILNMGVTGFPGIFEWKRVLSLQIVRLGEGMCHAASSELLLKIDSWPSNDKLESELCGNVESRSEGGKRLCGVEILEV